MGSHDGLTQSHSPKLPTSNLSIGVTSSHVTPAEEHVLKLGNDGSGEAFGLRAGLLGVVDYGMRWPISAVVQENAAEDLSSG